MSIPSRGASSVLLLALCYTVTVVDLLILFDLSFFNYTPRDTPHRGLHSEAPPKRGIQERVGGTVLSVQKDLSKILEQANLTVDSSEYFKGLLK